MNYSESVKHCNNTAAILTTVRFINEGEWLDPCLRLILQYHHLAPANAAFCPKSHLPCSKLIISKFLYLFVIHDSILIFKNSPMQGHRKQRTKHLFVTTPNPSLLPVSVWLVFSDILFLHFKIFVINIIYIKIYNIFAVL